MYLPPYSINGSDLLHDIVSRDYRTADVLSNYQIDFLVNTGTLQEACSEKGLNLEEVQLALTQATRNIYLSNGLPFNDWKIEFLIDYITNIHHEYFRRKAPELYTKICGLVDTDANNTLNLPIVCKAFEEVYHFILPHLNNEETSVFPYLKQITSAWTKKETYGALLVRTLRKPIEKTLLNEHNRIKELMVKLRQVTNYYDIPADASLQFKVVMSQLKEFDDDLVQHLFLENNILLPKVMVIEKELLSLTISA